MHPRLFDRVREVVPPVKVQERLGNGAKDATAARTADGEVDVRARGVVHDERRGRGQWALASFGVVERGR